MGLEKTAKLHTQHASRQIIGIDFIRFFAALTVAFYHLFFWRNGAGPISGAGPITSNIWFGWIGVQIFFVISGFVIAFSAESSSAARFLWHRALRLYPCVWICATITLFTTAYMAEGHYHGILLRYLISMALWPRGNNIDVVYWTLQIEVIFYALVAVILFFKQIRRLAVIMSFIGCFSAIFWLCVSFGAALHFPHRVQGVLHILADSRSFSSLLGHHGCFFAIGVIIYHIYTKPNSWKSYVVLAICIIGGMNEVAYQVWIEHAKYRIATHSDPFLPMIIWLASVAALVIALKYNSHITAALKPATGLIRFLGLMTFPLYLIHDNNGLFFQKVFMTHGLSERSATLCALFCVLAMAAIITLYFEPFVKNIFKSRFESRKPKYALGKHPPAEPLTSAAAQRLD